MQSIVAINVMSYPAGMAIVAEMQPAFSVVRPSLIPLLKSSDSALPYALLSGVVATFEDKSIPIGEVVIDTIEVQIGVLNEIK